jgi:hypothetical protein
MVRQFVALACLLVFAPGCHKAADAPQAEAGSRAESDNSGTQKPSCPSGGCGLLANPGERLVCLFEHCDHEPDGPCKTGSCPPDMACVSELQRYCPDCEHPSGCMPRPVCDGVEAGDDCVYTPTKLPTDAGCTADECPVAAAGSEPTHSGGGGGGSQKPACPSDGCASIQAGLVCLFAHCDTEPDGPCKPGTCPPGSACIFNLRRYCPDCTPASGCMPAPVCDGVPAEDDCTYTTSSATPVDACADEKTCDASIEPTQPSQDGGTGSN